MTAFHGRARSFSFAMGHLDFRNPVLLLLSSLLFLEFLSSPASADLTSETQALLSFAAAVFRGRTLNWAANSSVCSPWPGVTCSPDQTHVIALRLPGKGLVGTIPPNTLGKLDSLQVLSLRSNRLAGSLPSDILSIVSLQYCYLQRNRFSGEIPPSLSSSLTSIDLSRNSFMGQIPASIGSLSKLSMLYLQENSISGPIPDIDLASLNRLNLSFNNLNGTIPLSLQRFPASSFQGNPRLCGIPLNQCSASTPSPSPTSLAPESPRSHRGSSRHKFSLGLIIAIAVGGSAVLLLITVVFIFCCSKSRERKGSGEVETKASERGTEKRCKEMSSGVQVTENNKLVFFDGCCYNFDLEDLLRASAEVLGKGIYGTTYKALMEDSTTVVVKRLKEVIAGRRDFEQQMEIIGQIGQHPNLVSLRAYYYSKDEKLLVSDYCSFGSVSSLLHGNGGPGKSLLTWTVRVKVIIGTAYGIKHIHSEGGSKLTHGNIKSSNILLDRDLNPYISDYCLSPLLNPPSVTSRVAVGYRAPETIEAKKITQKSDVYSFGVLLMEMLTGKAPLHSQGPDDVPDLPRWVHSVVKEEWTAEVFDVGLMREQNIEEEMVQMLHVAMACTVRSPEQRPKMDDIIRMIEEVHLSGSGSHTSTDDNSRERNA